MKIDKLNKIEKNGKNEKIGVFDKKFENRKLNKQLHNRATKVFNRKLLTKQFHEQKKAVKISFFDFVIVLKQF